MSTSLVIPSIVCLLVLVTSCLRAPRPVQQSSDSRAVAAEAIGIETTTGSGETGTENPSAADGLAALHAEQKSCASCHEKKSSRTRSLRERRTVRPVTAILRLPIENFSAICRRPSTCESCHARPATAGLRAYPNQGPPIGFDPNNKTTPGSGHYVGKDCSSCHATPAEGGRTFIFSHSTPKADFCLPCHFNEGRGEHVNDTDVILRDFGNCFSCHLNFDRNATRNFDTNGD